MRSLSALMVLTSLTTFCRAQEGFHEHDGFYLSMNVGPAFGPIEYEAKGLPFQKMEFSGPGLLGDLKIGGAPMKNLILSFDYVFRTMPGPDVDVDGTKSSASDHVQSNDYLYGLGVTYYFMPVNIFVNATLGASKFILVNDSTNTNSSSKAGFGMQFKVGKEWWTGANWGLGISGGFALSAADDKTDASIPGYSGKLSTGKFFILFNTTYN